VVREAHRLRRRQRSADVKRLFELRSVGAVLDEIARCVLRLTRARRVELLLEASSETCARQSPQERPGTQRADKRLVLPLRDGEDKLATLHIIDPPTTETRHLRDYVVVATRALAVTLRLRRAETSARYHDALVNSLSDTCLLELDGRGRVCNVRGGSRALERHLGACVGCSLEDVANDGILGLTRTDVKEELERARRQGRSETQASVRTQHGQVDVQMVCIDVGTNDELLCMVRDLTEVKAIETALLRRNHELSVAAERLKEVDILKNEFMSNVSHELRTPLTAIIAYAEALLLTTPDQKTHDEFLHVICEQGHKLQELIGGLLDIAKLDSLATELKLELGSLNDVIESAIVTVQPTADKNQIRMELQLEPDLPPVYLDELRSQQIVWNLLTNAIKFSPARGKVMVRSWTSRGHVWASVTDEGPGIAPEHQKLIFEKFVQLDGSSTRRHGGVGLGLDLVKHLVELHGGEVHLESRVGHGATFTFGIPVEKRSRPRFGPKVLSRTHQSS
jgi:signal transduction histidine kinase